MHEIWSSLGGLYCLNNIESSERYENVYNVFKTMGVEDKVQFHTINSKISKWNAVVKIFQNENKKHEGINKPIAIFEDDFLFDESKTQLLDDFIPIVNAQYGYDYEKWDTIKLGYSKALFVEHIFGNVYRGNAHDAYCVIFSPHFIKQILQKYVEPVSLKGKDININVFTRNITGRNYMPYNCIFFPGSDNDSYDNVSKNHVESVLDEWTTTLQLWNETKYMTVYERITYYHKQCLKDNILAGILDNVCLM
jgi:hypothetical protein